MTIRPIIFSAEMVRALLEGRKTQTRRLATSPLRKCEPGDLLYVREHWRVGKHWDDTPPRAIDPTIMKHGEITYIADATANELRGKHRQGMHMPRWASRLTLRVTEVRTEPLININEHDSQAEGCKAIPFPGPWWQGYRNLDGRLVHQEAVGKAPPDWMIEPKPMGDMSHLDRSAKEQFGILWASLHTKPGERWEDNPQIVALTFEVIHSNVDEIAREG